MKKKFLGRVLTMLLVASMVFTLLPASAVAAGNWWWNADEYTEEAVPTATADNYSRILHLDCGRKYFSKDWIIALLHEMQDAGYNQLELAFGNDGLRFLLKDMTFVANGTTYDHDTIVKKVEAGNKLQNSSNDSRWLTEAEMDEIIAAANGLGIEIVPLLNLPGHANTILDIADDTLNASGSNNTLDVANSEAARNFGTAIFEKYLEYFNGKGCHYFCFGADEYANDAGTPFSFSRLNTVQYANFASFINTLSEKIDAKGMTPRAFNDGLYYDHGAWDMNTSVNNNIPKIQCCYWSSGWGDYPVASASTIAQKGHKMINTHGDWYYVTKYNKYGQEEIQIPSDSAIRGFSNTAFSGSKINNPVGSMFCIWCDAPAIRTEQEIAGNIRLLLRKMAARMQDKSIDTINTGIVTGGFNEDGSLNTAPVQPEPGITITPEGGTTGTTGAPKLDAAQPEQLKLTASEKVLWRWNSEVVNLTSADPAEETGTIALYTMDTLEAQSVFVTPVAAGDPMVEVTTLGENPTTTKYPIEVVNSAAPTDGPIIELKVGDDETVPVEGHNYANDVNKAELKENIATVTVTGKDAVKTDPKYNSEGDQTLSTIVGNLSGREWQKTKYWYHPADADSGVYYPVYATQYFLTYYVGYSTTDNANDVKQEKTQSVLGNAKYMNVYTRTEGVDKPASTTITFHGVAAGTTYVTIGGTKYTINVTDKAPDETLASDTITLEHWITNAVVGPEEKSQNNTTVISKTETAVSSDEGLEIKSKAFTPGYWDSTVVTYWQAVRLDSAHKQTTQNGTDKTADGTVLTHIRYHGGAWQYKTLGGDWTYFQSDDQLVAYYLQEKTVTPEVTTYFKDYGYGTDDTTPYDSNGQVALTVAVVYPDGTVSPAEGEMYSKSTTIFNYWGNRDIGIVSTANNEDYTISKITVTDGTRASNTTENQWYTSDTINWNKREVEGGTAEWYAETVVWDEVTNAGTTPMANGTTHKDCCTWSRKNTAKLVLIYLKPVEKETNLNLVYRDETDNQDIKSSQIVMKYTQGSDIPTYFNSLYNGGTVNQLTGVVTGGTLIAKDNKTAWPGKTASEADYLPDAAYVVNSANVAQHFNKEIARIPGVAPKYQSGFYKYDGAEISADGKTLTLRYVIDDTKLENQYVIDFGLPLHIPLRDIVGDADNKVEAVYANGIELSGDTDYIAQHGTLRYDAAAKEIIYKRTATFSDDTISTASFQVRYSGDTALSKTFTIGVLPASNVLYEASFLEQASKDNGPAWKLTATTTRTQQTQKVGDTTTNYAVFGRDTAYNNAYGALGAWTASGLNFKSSTGALTTSFYGNGFDLIGNCGPKTGRVILFVKNAETGKGKLVDVDTRYGADTFYQVPLAHVMMDEEASYNVTVYAAGLKATNATPASYSLRGAATYASDYAADSYDAVLNGVLAENGLTMADVEYVKVESAPAAAKTARRATSFYALDTAAETGTVGPVTHEAGDHVEIDGFRVYRSANNANYPTSEQNVRYLNILDAVSSFTAFVEGSTADSKWEARDKYENDGGPQNEIYLRKTDGTGSAIAFKVDPNAIVQISARAVENKKAAKLYVNGVETEIKTNTEMYYTYTAGADGIVTIKNEGEGMLALGNLKIKNGTQAAALSEEDYPAAIALLSLNAAPETPDTVFEPTISAKVTTTRFIRSKVVTLTVSASADVAKLTVNGKELRPTNGWLVSMGWSKSYNYILTETVKKSETKTYEIIGYSADGAASTPTVVTSK